MCEEKVFQYRKDYLDTLIERYCTTDEPDYIIDIQTLKIVESGENVKRIPEFGKLTGYYCEPAQKLINEMMKLYPHRPKKLSKKNKKKRKHVSVQSKRRNVYSRLKRKEKRHIPLELDTSAGSKSLTCSETHVDVTKSVFISEDIPIDPCSFINNSSKKLKRNNNTLSLDKTNFCKSGILSSRIAGENRKQIISKSYFKHENNAYSPHLSKGAYEAENSYCTNNSNTYVNKENKGDRKYVKLIKSSFSSQKEKNKHAKNLDINMPLKDTNEAENNFIHMSESNTFEQCMEEMKHKEHISEFCLTHQESSINHGYLNSNIPKHKKLEFVSQLTVNSSTVHNETTDLIVESSFKGENSSSSLTSSSTLSKEYSSDSMSIELKNKSTAPHEIERLKNKQSDKLDVANKQIVTKDACHTVKFTASTPTSQKTEVSRNYSDEFSVNTKCCISRYCRVSCRKLDVSQYKISETGSFILNSTEMSCSDKPFHKKVNVAKNSSLSITSSIVSKYFMIVDN